MRYSSQQLKDKAAAAYTSGNLRQALDLYEELCRREESPNTLQRAGELCRRVGRIPDALGYLMRAVDKYAEEGFVLKGVALCRMTLEWAPDHKPTQDRLAGLSQRLAAQTESTKMAALRQGVSTGVDWKVPQFVVDNRPQQNPHAGPSFLESPISVRT